MILASGARGPKFKSWPEPFSFGGLSLNFFLNFFHNQNSRRNSEFGIPNSGIRSGRDISPNILALQDISQPGINASHPLSCSHQPSMTMMFASSFGFHYIRPDEFFPPYPTWHFELCHKPFCQVDTKNTLVPYNVSMVLVYSLYRLNKEEDKK